MHRPGSHRRLLLLYKLPISRPLLGHGDRQDVRMSEDQEIGDRRPGDRRENRRVGLSSNKDPVLIILYNRDLKLCVRERAVARE